jgi:DNA-binding CsgD family transcriptional regulator
MSDVDQRFTDALGRIMHASAVSQVWASVKEFAQHLGYTHLAGADGAHLAGGAADAVFYTDAPRVPGEIDRTYSYASAPFVTRALSSPVPFLISELRRDPKHAGAWTDLFADAVKRGDGLIVPVYDGDEPLAGFIFGGENPDTSSLARAMLQVVAHAAFSRYRALRTDKAAATRHTLSVREIQCLRSLAAGKTDGDTAVALGISARTVRFHIDGAKTKLQVGSRVQAVAKALQEKIIAV